MVKIIVSLLASVLTAVQAFLEYRQENGFCFNGGCEIVESLTTVPPFYFNVAGFLFFQTLFWCFLWGRKGSEYWHKFAKLLLIGGIVAEAVLVFFQYSVVTVFCSYCLIIGVTPPLDPARKFMTLAELEKHYILEVLEATGGNKSKATELLGISRAALWRKLKQFKEDKHRS